MIDFLIGDKVFSDCEFLEDWYRVIEEMFIILFFFYFCGIIFLIWFDGEECYSI